MIPNMLLRTARRTCIAGVAALVVGVASSTAFVTPTVAADGPPSVADLAEGLLGAVVNISSVMGRVSGRGYLAYGTAKAALSHYTRLAARDLAPVVRVNAIAVGSVATSALDIVLNDDATRATMEATTPLRRIGDPDDIAATVLFLASDAGAYVTGKVIEADGGLDQPNLDLGIPDPQPGASGLS